MMFAQLPSEIVHPLIPIGFQVIKGYFRKIYSKNTGESLGEGGRM